MLVFQGSTDGRVTFAVPGSDPEVVVREGSAPFTWGAAVKGSQDLAEALIFHALLECRSMSASRARHIARQHAPAFASAVVGNLPPGFTVTSDEVLIALQSLTGERYEAARPLPWNPC